MRRLLTLLGGALLVGCSTTPPAEALSPEDLDWRLVELAGAAALATDGGAPTLRLAAAEGRARGNTGCNGYSGGYTLRGESLAFGPLVSTRRACTDEGMNRQETAYMALLAEARRWRMDGDTLVIETAGGARARLVRS